MTSYCYYSVSQEAQWLQDRQRLVQSHNETKSSLINEIRVLRQALNPSGENTYKELMKKDQQCLAIEEELVKSHMYAESLKVCLLLHFNSICLIITFALQQYFVLC